MKKDILLNDEWLNGTAETLNAIAQQSRDLRDLVEKLLDELQKGLDTPAGRRLVISTATLLLQPLRDQSEMMDHVAESLRTAGSTYRSVFEEYKALNARLNTDPV